VLLSAHDAFAEFPEGEARRRRIGAGLDYRFRRWTARASVTATTAGEDAGLRSFVSYRLNDVLRLGARFETESNATPLRGARVGVSSTLVGTEAIWQPHESTRVDAGIELIDLSDGNRTLALRAAGEHRLVNLLTYDLSGLASIDVIRNDDDNVSYFSPIRSVVWTAGLRNEHQIFRRYDFALAHSLTARVGQHIQKFYGSDAIWNIEYRFNADINDRMYTYIGISRASNVYDGDREYRTAGIAGFGGRF
jgi:biofilm PGA synthesis protein PgaA